MIEQTTQSEILSFERIKTDLDETQYRLEIALEKDANSKESRFLSEKMTKIVTWLMQNRYIED